MKHYPNPGRLRRRQAGTAAVELALVSLFFFTLLFGIVEMGRMLFYWNSAAEATRLGARLAVVCDLGDAEIKSKMIAMWSHLTDARIAIEYLDPPNPINTCTINTCKSVRVSINSFDEKPIIPFVNLMLAVPPFSTTLPRESMTSLNNAVCS